MRSAIWSTLVCMVSPRVGEHLSASRAGALLAGEHRGQRREGEGEPAGLGVII
jgi:hypothetical protein